jgi:hypothetical protein
MKGLTIEINGFSTNFGGQGERSCRSGGGPPSVFGVVEVHPANRPNQKTRARSGNQTHRVFIDDFHPYKDNIAFKKLP